jgi:hypothetical protein
MGSELIMADLHYYSKHVILLRLEHIFVGRVKFSVVEYSSGRPSFSASQSLLSQVAPPRQLRRLTLALLLPARHRRTGPPDQPKVTSPPSRDLTDDPPPFAAPTRLSGRRTASSGLWRRSPPTPNALWSCGLDPCRAAALLGMQLWLRRPRA